MDAEKEKKPRGFSFLKLILFLLILVVISGVALYSFLGINPASVLAEGVTGLYNRVFTTGAAKLTEKVKVLNAFDIGEEFSCDVVSDDLVMVSGSSVRQLDSEGREKAFIPVTLKKPHVQVYKNDVLVSDLGGRYFALINGGKLLWEKTINEDIVNASISDGWVLLITKSSQAGYKRSIRAYSRDGQEISLRNVSNYYPYSAAHYPEFNKACFIINGIEASGLESNGLVEFLDPSMNQKASIRGEKEIFASGIPLKDKQLLLYGERSLFAVDNGYKTVWEKKLDHATITGATALQNMYPVYAELNTDILSREKRYETTVRILNSNGTEKAKLVLDDKIAKLSSEGRTIALLVGSEVFFINDRVEVMDKFTSKSQVEGVYLAREDLAYIVSSGTISRVKITVTNKFLGIF